MVLLHILKRRETFTYSFTSPGIRSNRNLLFGGKQVISTMMRCSIKSHTFGFLPPNMKTYLFALFCSFCVIATRAQQAVPEWVLLMHQPNADIGLVHDAYEKYYAEHPFEKNTWTQEYKRLMHMHTQDNNGSMFG